MKEIWDWLNASNRIKHLGLGFAYGLGINDWYCASYGGIGVSLALEFKDGQWGGKPDLVDAANNGSFISKPSQDALLSTLSAALGGTLSATWNATTGHYDYTFTPNS